MTARILFPAFIALLAIPYGLIAEGFPVVSLEEGFGPGLFPGIIAIIIGTLAGMEFVVQTVKALSGSPRQPLDDLPRTSVTFRELLASVCLVGAIIAAVLSIRYIGFVAAGSALVFALSLAMGMRPVWLSAICAIAVAATVHLVFSGAFGLVLAF